MSGRVICTLPVGVQVQEHQDRIPLVLGSEEDLSVDVDGSA